MPTQAHFSEDYSHFFLKGKQMQRKKREKPKKSTHYFHSQTSGVRKNILRGKAYEVKKISLSRKVIYDDHRLYFTIVFSDSFRWTSIRKALESLNGSITEVYDEKTVKLAVDSRDYDRFVQELEDNRRYIADIRETSAEEKLKDVSAIIKESPNQAHKLTIEVIDLNGLSKEKAYALGAALEKFVRTQSGNIELDYVADKYAIYTAKLYPRTIKEIAEKVELIENIHVLPEISLVHSLEDSFRSFGLASVISISEPTSQRLPTVCAIDSGIN
jgi:hypothetical protein